MMFRYDVKNGNEHKILSSTIFLFYFKLHNYEQVVRVLQQLRFVWNGFLCDLFSTT